VESLEFPGFGSLYRHWQKQRMALQCAGAAGMRKLLVILNAMFRNQTSWQPLRPLQEA